VWSRSRSGEHWPSQWDPRVADIAHFVEKERGLTFVHPVDVEFLPPPAFTKKLVGKQEPTPKEKRELQRFLEVFRALGLVEGQVDLLQSSRKLAGQSVVGFYSTEEHKAFVRSGALDPAARVTMAHELTHALQDQRFGISGFHPDNSGQAEAFRAVIEADAIRVQEAYAKHLSPDDARAYEASERAGAKQAQDTTGIPEALVDDLQFPYAFGPSFLEFVSSDGGNAAVDRVMRHLPVSEAQIIDPASFLTGVKVVKVPSPKLGPGQTRILKAGDMGQVSLLVVLGDRLPYETVWPAVRGWAGDATVSYREGGRTCVAIATSMGTVPDAQRLESVERAWAASMPKASVRRNDVVVELRSCDPGKNAAAHKPPQPSPFQVLEVRAGLLQGLHGGGVPSGLAACVADGTIAQAGPAALVALNDESPPPGDPRVVQIQRLVTRVARACQNGEHPGA